MTKFGVTILAVLIMSPWACASPKIIHVYVALCDNQSQGIVPVPKVLGNGNDPANNLYWGALYGVKAYFKRSKTWTLLRTKTSNHPLVAERSVFQHTRTRSLLIADAYRGDKIRECLQAYFIALSGHNSIPVRITENKTVRGGGRSDLLAYIGHNGLMDFKLTAPAGDSSRARDSIILACYSKKYFLPLLKKSGARPLLLTNGFMAPEAYTLHDALASYLQNKAPAQIKLNAAAAYAKYQKCSSTAAQKLFYTRSQDNP